MRQSFDVDYQALDTRLNKKAYRLADVQDKIERVAFDVVRFRDDDSASKLWQVQSANDGQGDIIVALYDEPEVEKTASPWSVVLSKVANELHISYQGDPLVKVATASLGIPSDELASVERYLPVKLASNKNLVKALLNQLPAPAKKLALEKHPELA